MSDMSKKDEAKRLVTERDEIDKEIEEQMKVLEANNCTMDNSLVDEEGFPIASIDVYSVRHARNAIIRMRNDRKALTDQIAEALAELHQENPQDEAMEASNQNDEIKPVHRTSNTPFVKVTSVTAGSPAAEAGLEVNDEIIQYGILHFGNFTQLQQFASYTKDNEGKVIRVTVIRNMRPVRVEVRPKPWNGRGLLGCAVVPIQSSDVI